MAAFLFFTKIINPNFRYFKMKNRYFLIKKLWCIYIYIYIILLLCLYVHMCIHISTLYSIYVVYIAYTIYSIYLNLKYEFVRNCILLITLQTVSIKSFLISNTIAIKCWMTRDNQYFFLKIHICSFSLKKKKTHIPDTLFWRKIALKHMALLKKKFS